MRSPSHRPEPPVRDGGVDAHVGLVVKLGDADEVEVADEAGRDGVAAAAGRAHRRHELDVVDLAEGVVRAIVPATCVGAEGADLRTGKETRAMGNNVP